MNVVDRGIVKSVLKRLDIDYIDNRNMDNYVFRCIDSDHIDIHPSCYMHKGKGIWHCFSCKACGTLVDFVKLMLDSSDRKAIKFIFGSNGNVISNEERKTRVLLDMLNGKVIKTYMSGPNVIRIDKYKSFRNLKDWSHYDNKFYKYVVDRGVTIECIKTMDLKYCVKGKYKNRIIVPVYMNDVCYGFVARDITNKSNAKYLYPRGMNVEKVLYNLGETGNEVVLVEGVFDVLSLISSKKFKIKPLAILGSNISSYQVRLLVESGVRRINLAFDNDRAGNEVAEGFIKEYSDMFKIYMVKLPEGEDVSSISIGFFKKCFNRRKRVEKRDYMKSMREIKAML